MSELVPKPTWNSQRISLRPIVQADLPDLYELSRVNAETAIRWRYRGAVPDFAEFSRLLSQGVLIQFVARERASGALLGLVTAYNANIRDGWVYVSGIASKSGEGRGLILEGLRILIDYLFATWPFRKVYIEAIEFNLDQFHGLPSNLFVEEARLKEHVFYGARYWDVLTLSVSAEAWRTFGGPTLSRVSWGPVSEQNIALRKTERVLGIDEFCALVVQEIEGVESSSRADPDARLHEDLGFDSLSMLQLSELIDELTGLVELLWPATLETLRDVYTWYLAASNAPLIEQGP